jgi:hypothetical protein
MRRRFIISLRVPTLAKSSTVMPGLVPGIYVFLTEPIRSKAWMAGTSPAMTNVVGGKSPDYFE